MKRILMLFAALAVFTQTVFAQEKDILERYEYDENFEYSDEIMGDVLKTVTGCVEGKQTATLRYKSISVDKSGLKSKIQRTANEYAKYVQNGKITLDEAVAYIFDEIDNFVLDYISFGSEQVEELSLGWGGSCVSVSEDGYFVTNQHVVEGLIGDERKMGFLYSSNLMNSIYDALSVLESSMPNGYLDEDRLAQFESIFLAAVGQGATLSESEYEYNIFFADADGNTSLDAAISYPAKVIKEGKYDIDESGNLEELDARDAAVLKIDVENWPALIISQNEPKLGTQVKSAGFPGISDLSDAAKYAVTIKPGEISKIMDVENSEYKIYQVSQEINQGMSGGPCVSNKLTVQGLNTWGTVNGSNKADFIVSSEYLLQLTKNLNGIGQGDTAKIFLLGMQALQKGYGATAEECFTEVKELNRNTPYINSLIKDAQNAPQKSMPSKSINVKKCAGIAACVLAAAAALAVAAAIAKKLKSARRAVMDNDTYVDPFKDDIGYVPTGTVSEDLIDTGGFDKKDDPFGDDDIFG